MITCTKCGSEDYIITIQDGKKSYHCDNCHHGFKNPEDYQAFIQVVRDFIRTYRLTRKWQEYIHNRGHVEIIEKMAKLYKV